MRVTFRAVAACGALLLHAHFAGAHGGEDHGAPAAPTRATASGARAYEAQTALYEAVLKFAEADVREPLAMHLFLTDFATNEPVRDARVSVSMPDLQLELQAAPSATVPGLYELTASPGREGSFPVIVSVTAPRGGDLLVLDAVTFGPSEDSTTSGTRWRPWLLRAIAALAVVGAALVTLVLVRRRRAAAAIVVMFVLIAPRVGRAHGGEDHGAPPRANVASTIAVVPKEAQIAFGIRTTLAEPVAVTGRREWRGTIVARPNGKADVIAPQSGRVMTLEGGLPTVGDVVRKGQPLLAVEGFLSPQEQVDVRTAVAEAEAREIAARQEASLAQSRYERLQSVPDVVSRREMEEAAARVETARGSQESARRALGVLRAASQGARSSAARYVLEAPIDGVVTAGSATAGEAVEAGRLFFTILDPSVLWVRVDVAESDAGVHVMQAGAPARIVLPGSRSTPVAARFVSSGRSIDPVTRTVPAFLEADGSSGLLFEGQLVQVHAETGTSTTGFLLPESALVSVAGRDVVFSHVQAEEFAPRDVTLGLRSQGQVEVLGGIEAGDRIVVTGASQVRAALLAGR